ncbi:MAG TPA: DUF805 domain-containing protein [Candidatus Limnocylindria bacterium]|nr:DUF805 domain-containing protein [Candidatus Limnocylindria bacterium]
MQWYLAVLKKYALFEGRARRKEYWMFTVLHGGIYITLATLGWFIHFPALALIYVLATFVPAIAVAIRRLHDTGRSGWFFLLALLPFVGGLILLYFFVQDGTQGDNAYGANPKVLSA